MGIRSIFSEGKFLYRRCRVAKKEWGFYGRRDELDSLMGHARPPGHADTFPRTWETILATCSGGGSAAVRLVDPHEGSIYKAIAQARALLAGSRPRQAGESPRRFPRQAAHLAHEIQRQGQQAEGDIVASGHGGPGVQQGRHVGIQADREGPLLFLHEKVQ